MHQYTKLAKEAIENYTINQKIIEPSTKLLKGCSGKKAGVFITITKNDRLRGCIGTFLPTQKNIYQEIIKNAISAATADPRFNPVSFDELNELNYEVSILNSPKPVNSTKELNPEKFGIIVKGAESGKVGLLLPNLDDVVSIEDQINIACSKAGIDLSKEKITVFKFGTKKYI